MIRLPPLSIVERSIEESDKANRRTAYEPGWLDHTRLAVGRRTDRAGVWLVIHTPAGDLVTA